MLDENSRRHAELLFQMQYDGVQQKFSILPVISGLLLAILAIGISGDLFEVNNIIKYIATALLLLTVLSLQIYFSEVVNLSKTARKALFELLNKENADSELTFSQSILYLLTGKAKGVDLKKDFFDRLSSLFPAYALVLVWWIVFLIIFQIWI